MVAWTLVHATSSWQSCRFQDSCWRPGARGANSVWTKVHTPGARLICASGLRIPMFIVAWTLVHATSSWQSCRFQDSCWRPGARGANSCGLKSTLPTPRLILAQLMFANEGSIGRLFPFVSNVLRSAPRFNPLHPYRISPICRYMFRMHHERPLIGSEVSHRLQTPSKSSS